MKRLWSYFQNLPGEGQLLVVLLLGITTCAAVVFGAFAREVYIQEKYLAHCAAVKPYHDCVTDWRRSGVPTGIMVPPTENNR